MPRSRKPARLVRWRGKPHVFYTDYAVFPPVQRRVHCEAVGAHTSEERAALVKKYRQLEIRGQHAVIFGHVAGAHETPLMTAIADYLREIESRVQARAGAGQVRVGLAPSSGERIRDSIKLFTQWVERRNLGALPCGDLQAKHLDDFRSWLATHKQDRSPHTINLDLRNLKGALSWLGRLRPERLRDTALLISALKPLPAQAPEPVAYRPDDLMGFYEIAVQRNQLVADLFRFLACTGCRRGEAVNLLWDDVDTERGRITFRAQKTGRLRTLPLVGAPEGDVAPRLLAWLKANKGEGRVFDHFPEKAWDNVLALSRAKIMPQGLRSNFTSYAASLGIPAAVCALWQGHSAQVAERFYRAQILDRKKAATVEGAMGFGVPDTL